MKKISKFKLSNLLLLPIKALSERTALDITSLDTEVFTKVGEGVGFELKCFGRDFSWATRELDNETA